MHAKELCFATASYVVMGEDEKVREAVEIRDNKKETVVTFVFEEDIPKGVEIVMTIEYSVRSFYDQPDFGLMLRNSVSV